MTKRLILAAATAAVALGATGTVHASGPDNPIAPPTRVIDGITLALPPGYGGGPSSLACQFAIVSDGGVLAMPAGYGGGTVACH